jgi:hypothetical protein
MCLAFEQDFPLLIGNGVVLLAQILTFHVRIKRLNS